MFKAVHVAFRAGAIAGGVGSSISTAFIRQRLGGSQISLIKKRNIAGVSRMAGNEEYGWTSPSREGKMLTGLVVRNSFHPPRKVEFVPEAGGKVNWYCCGPTVYDAAHLGHARTYVTCDSLRSILTNYFNYDVNFVVNVTDIDDKIIQRALDEGKTASEVSQHWEKEFWSDMQSLGVDPPTRVTRVTEFIPEIIAFISKLIQGGYAYESHGSVYFDTQAFTASGHVYGKLEPHSINDIGRALEGEGVLTATEGDTIQKRSPGDFCLWKKSKPNEPFWSSPWGEGRPGWHIECSAMCESVFGAKLDIHSGGIDLRFPHHENEVAQSEAYHDSESWVNYFIHFGHLHIHGMKMSKSLKNFTTVKEVMARYNARQIRILFLLTRYDATLNFQPGYEGMAEAVAVDETLYNFFASLNDILKRTSIGEPNKFTSEDNSLEERFSNLKQMVHAALLDNFDTPRVISEICKFVSAVNVAIGTRGIKHIQALAFKGYLNRILRVLKLVEPSSDYGEDASSQSNATPDRTLVDRIVHIRQVMRSFAQEKFKDNPEGCKELIQLCDNIRDVWLPEFGVVLEDRETGSVLKFRGRAELEREKLRRQDKLEQLKRQENERIELMNTKPEDFIQKKFPGKFKTFDDECLPVEHADGQKVSKSERASLRKLLEKHRTQYLKRLNGN